MDDSNLACSKSCIGRALWLFPILVLLTTALSWWVYLASGSKQFLRPLFTDTDRFGDLTQYSGKMAHLLGQSRQLGSGLPVYNYPAPAAFVYKALLFAVPSHPVAPYVIVTVTFVLVMTAVFWRVLNSNTWLRMFRIPATLSIIAAVWLGFPLAFTLDRANLEAIVWIFASIGVCLMLAQRFGLAALMIGIAAAIKPFPGLFLLILVARKKYKEAVTGALLAACIFVLALVGLGPNPFKASVDLKQGVNYYLQRYVTNLPPPEEVRFDHSLMDRAKYAAVMANMRGPHPIRGPIMVDFFRQQEGGWPTSRIIYKMYPVLLIVPLGLILWFFRSRPLLNQVTAAAIAINILPPVASDYTLIHLSVPFAAWLLFLMHSAKPGAVRLHPLAVFTITVEYALLFSPLTFLRLNAADAKLLCMLALLITMARVPMPCEFFGDKPSVGEDFKWKGSSNAVRA